MTAKRLSPETDKHLTVEELAAREGVPVQTVYQWNRRHTGPEYMRVGKYVRYSLAAVLAWEKSQVVGTARHRAA